MNEQIKNEQPSELNERKDIFLNRDTSPSEETITELLERWKEDLSDEDIKKLQKIIEREVADGRKIRIAYDGEVQQPVSYEENGEKVVINDYAYYDEWESCYVTIGKHDERVDHPSLKNVTTITIALKIKATPEEIEERIKKNKEEEKRIKKRKSKE